MRKIKCINVMFAHKDADILYSIEDLRKMDHIPASHMEIYEDCDDAECIGFVKNTAGDSEFIQAYTEKCGDVYELGEEINS